MRRILIVFILLAIIVPCWSQAQIVTDSLGNRLKLNDWTRFDHRHQFHHPNGHDYPSDGLFWVHARDRKEWYSGFQGWLTFGGLIWAVTDASLRDNIRNYEIRQDLDRFMARLSIPWLWGYCLDSSNPTSCRWAGGLTGGIWAIDQAHLYKWSFKRGPTWEEGGIVAAEIAGTYLVGYLLDKIRRVPPKKPDYYYRFRSRN